VAGRATDLKDGARLASAAIDDGRAIRLLDRAREALA
jgi:anthranilate phosphoribosyltransferase